MAGKYDAILDAEQGGAPAAGSNRYDTVLDQEVEQNQKAARFVFERALAVNPDQAAESKKLTNTTGLPLAVVERNLDEVKRKEQARMLDLARMAQDSPVLARQLVDPSFTNQAHDHLDKLSALEQTFNVVRAVPAGGARGLGSMLAGSGELIDIGARNIGLTAVSRAVRDLTGADPAVALDVAGSLKFAGSGWKMLADAIGPDKEAQNFATDVAGGIGQLIQQIGVQIATGGTASLVSLFSQGADVMADKTKGDKASQAMRDTAVLTGASITALTEKYGIDALLNRVPPAIKNSALRWVADKLVAGGIEATQEITEGVLQDTVRKLLTNPNATIGDGSLYEASVAGTSAAIVRAALGVRTRGAQEVQQGQQAERDAENLKAQLDLAAQALLRERNPEEFRSLVQTMADNTEGAPKEVYVDAEVLNQLAPEVLNQLPQSVRDALPDALAANDVVAIFLGDVLTVAPGTPLEQVLVENARIGDPRAMSQAEAKVAGSKAQEFLAQEAERVIAQAADQQAMQESSDRVRQGVLEQLNTVGRFRKDVNEAYATWTAAFYTTMAGRTGMTPEQMAAKYPLRVVGQGGQGAVLNEAAPITVRLGERDVPVKLGALDAQRGNVLVPVNAAAFDAAWRAGDTFNSFYIGPGGVGNTIGERYPQFGEFASTAPSIDASVVSVDQNGVVGFGDGRHRFAFMRDQGVQTIPVAMDAESLQNAIAAGYVEQGVFNQSVTTMVPTTKGTVVDPAIVKVPGIAEAEADDPKAKAALAANVELFNAKVQSIADEMKRGYNSITVEGNTPKEQAESIINQMVRNLLTIYDAIPPEVRDRSRLWYDGANRISLAFAERYNMTPMQAAAQLAVLSPQADWFMNVSYAERINDILEFQQDYTWDAEMEAWATDWMAASEDSRQKETDRRAQSVRDAERAVRDSERAKVRAETALEKNTPKLEEKIRTAEAALDEAHTATVEARKVAKKSGSKADEKALAKAEARETAASEKAKEARADMRAAKGTVSKAATAIRQAEKKLQERRDFAAEPDANVAVQPNVRGKKLSELETDFERAWWVRTYDEVHHPRAYRIVTPEGGFLGFAKNDDGTTDGTIAWKSFNPIAKAIGIRRDGSLANVHNALGGEHKVRNFYNNIYDPNAPQPFVTSDTHQVAANLFLPLGADALEVGQNFGGTGTKSVGSTGLNGTYWLYSEAVARAAAEVSKRGDGQVLPREMQSISWEAIRSLFSPTFKADADKVNAVRDLWDQHAAGEASYEDTIQAVINLAGGRYRDPSWVGVRPDSAAAPEAGLKSYESELAHARQGLAQRGEPGRGDAGVPGSTLSQGAVNDRPQQAGDGAGRSAGAGSAPLPGAPVIEGATGPDPRLVAVAEQYARDNGIDLKRQAEYVQVDPERAARVAAAYEAMQHNPQDPAVREAYQNLINQTVAQYRALEAAGYKFWFIDPTSDPYKSPWDAMRDLRATQSMGVFPTVAGFGSGATDVDITDNPLMADTGITWPYGSPDGELKPVLANDLFRAVHDAFGHGLEGAGFRAQGEENAWQAHIRLFTGSAKGAITSETRGQNSWLNFGPYGATNQTAKVEDTVFADQKTGLMPEWTWTEGLAGDMPEQVLEQGPRGTFNPKTLELALNENADLSTFLHETGHFFLEVMADLASQPDAPADVQQDLAALMKWFGVADLATWNGYSLDQKRPYHERFAESFEQYLMEGKAPSTELQPLFRKFRAWMLNVYKSLKAFVDGHPDSNIKLSPEIRQVFDRMLASDEQIAQANEVAGLLLNEEADAEATERLTARSLRDLKWTVNARAKAIKALQKQAKELRKEVEAEVTAEVNQMPEFQAKAALDQIRKDSKAQPTDADLAVVADSFGYPDVDSMLKAIDAIGKKSDVVEGMTDQRMLERHGDLIDQRAIEAAANEAVHNEARARSLATELKSQAEMLNPRTDTGQTNTKGSKITVNALVEAAKQFAANVVSKTPLRDLKAKAWQHTAAERRAGKRWQEATAKGETQDAVKAKQDQMLNNAAAKAAMDAQAEMRKILEFFKRVVKDGNEKTVEKGRDPDVVNAARAVLAAYGVAPKAGKTALEYMALVEKNDPAMFAALQPSVQGALNMAQPLDSLTMDELRGLHEEIQGMWHLAKRSRQMEVDGNMLDMDDAEAELQDRMQTIGVPAGMPGESGAMTTREELARKLQFAGSILRRVEQWAQGMGSEFTRLVFQPVKEAADNYRADRVKYRKAYQALVDAVAPTLVKGEIAAPELGYTFGRGHNGIGHAELLHAILHTGNASNKRKLLLGRGWATENADGTLDTSRWDAFLQRMLDTGVLTKAHYDFAQGVWDLLEQTKPLAQKTHRDVFGRYFAEVTADPVDTPFGQYRGGYVPAQADPRIVQDADLRKLAEIENENMAFAFPGTNKGFTKGRVEYNRPLMLDLRTIGQHIDKVLLFSHMEPAVRDVQKLLSRKGVSYSLGRIDPTIYAGMLTPWLNRSARQIVETPIVGDGGITRVLSAARGRAGMALMFANVSNALQQLTGFSLAAIKVKPASMMRATAQFIRSPRKTAKAVSDASPFMANRMENEISAINEAMDAILLDPSLYEKAQTWSQKHAYFLQTAMANTMEPIIWSAAYNEALEGGSSERDAVRHADSVIRTTQGSTLPEDVSRIETGPAYARMVTQFIGYFNMMANTNGTALQQLARETGLRKGAGKALGIVTLGMLTPIWVAEAIAQAMRGGPDDEDKDGYLDDWLAAVFGMGTIKGSLAMVPFVGQLANAGINRFNGNPADDKVSLSPAVSILESAVGVPVDVYKAITDPDKLNARNAVRDVASAVSIATGLPAVALARPLGYLAGVAQDKIEPTGPADMARGLVTGTPSPASK